MPRPTTARLFWYSTIRTALHSALLQSATLELYSAVSIQYSLRITMALTTHIFCASIAINALVKEGNLGLSPSCGKWHY